MNHRWTLRFQAWSLVVLLLTPLFALALVHRLWVRRRALVGLVEKVTGRGPAVPTGRVIVHGVSLGEVAMMQAVIPACAFPPILTTTTETGRAGLNKSYAQHVHAWWPLDLPWAVETFLRRTRPCAIVLLEAELWPVMLAACHRRGIPVIIANARASERSTRRLAAVRTLSAALLQPVRLIAAQTPLYAARFRQLGVARDRVAITGSIKADLVKPVDPASLAWCDARGIAADRPLLLLASTSPHEEATLLIGGLDAWWTRGWRIAICPRHPERGDELARLMVRLGGLPRRTSIDEALGARHNEVLIVDEIGRLGQLYARCAQANGIAIVGGSCGSGRGGQNMLEAAAAGCCTVVGWDTRAQPDPMALLRASDGVVELVPHRIAPHLAELAANDEQRRAFGARALLGWSQGRGALRHLDAHLRRVL